MVRAARPRVVAPAAAALAALAACAAATVETGRGGETRPPPKSAFVVLPPAALAAVKTPHDHEGKPVCQRCHEPDLKLVKPPIALCQECHAFPHRSHPVDVVQRTPAGGLPLLPGGKVACHTCHDPHQKKYVLRKKFDALCTSCHQK
jgi:predicted CXXCH cytochrome family protein